MSHVTYLNNHKYGFMNCHVMSLEECGMMWGDAAWGACGHAPGMPTACLLGENNLWLTNHTQELQGTSRDTVAIVVVIVATATTTMQPRSKKDTHKPDSRMELALHSNG